MGAGGGGSPGNCFNSTTILNENETKQIFKKLLLFTWMGTKTKQNQILWRYTQNSSFQKKTKMMHVSKMHNSFLKKSAGKSDESSHVTRVLRLSYEVHLKWT